MAPPHPSPSPSPSPAPLFVPDTFPALLRAVEQDEGKRAYAWGTQKGEARAVLGVVGGREVGDARGALERLLHRRGASGLTKKDEGEAGPELFARVEQGDGCGADFFPLPSPSSASSATAPAAEAKPFSVVLYSPLKHLEVLSLEALRLDFRLELWAAEGGAETELETRARKRVVEDAVHLINSSRPLLPPSSSSSAFRPPLALLLRAVRPFLALLHALVTGAVTTLAFPLPVVGPLRARSAFAYQLHTRLSQVLSLPSTWSSFQRALSSPSSSSSYISAHTSYIRFFNLLWLVANDLIVGYALSSFLRENAEYLASRAGGLLQNDSLSALEGLLEWLNTWPMGIKLNDDLSGLIVSLFLFLSRLWSSLILTPLLPSLPLLLRLSSYASLFGASALVALSSDALALALAPWTGCYALSALFYRSALVGLAALFNVFRGKKYNPLRLRPEPALYETDALLLGTLLFCVLAFLFPTFLAFYLSFLSARLAVKAVQGVLHTAVGALNAFPLFALMLRLKAPGRLPGGVQLDPCTRASCGWKGPHLHLRNQPLGWGAILGSLASDLNLPLHPSPLLPLPPVRLVPPPFRPAQRSTLSGM
ncbi:hypothetical protein JCM10213_007814 [Rhodosporidiobolus nylandii]